jgi:uncharacterized protein YybS (DUF2232 family)
MNLPEGNLPAFRLGSAGKEFFFHIVLTLSLFVSFSFIPLAGFLLGILTPLPTVLALIRHDVQGGWPVPAGAAVSGTLILFGMDMMHSVPYLLIFLGMGTVMGYGIRREWAAAKVIGFSGLILAAASVLFVVIAWVETDGELVKVLEQDLQGAISGAMKQFGTQSPETQALESTLIGSVPLMVRVMPGITFASALGIPWLNLLAARRYCSKMALEFCVRENLKCWKSPEVLVWPVIASGLSLLLPWADLQIVALNVLIVLGSIYFIQGLSIAAFYFEKWNMPFSLRCLIYAIVMLQQFASLATAALGLFDMWFDFRKMAKKPA